MPTNISGQIVVASRIVDYLSSGLYESPAACLKELVNNAYDADATLVELFVKPDANRIIVSDNGVGMNSADFQRNFSKISESFKRETSDKTIGCRPKIGKIGIGFIAANEICDVMQVISTKRGSREKIDIEINFAAMRMPAEERRRGEDSFAKADYSGVIREAGIDEHFTHIFLKEVRGPAQELLAGARNHGGNSLYGLTPDQIFKRLIDPGLRSWDDFDFYSQTMLEVALNVPVPYHPAWAGKHLDELKNFTRTARKLDFNVVFDGTELRKPVAFNEEEESFVRLFSHSGKEVSFKSYFYVQHGVLKPQELNGALIRIRNAAVGKYERGFYGFPNSTGTLFQRWISAEIWASDELEAAMNIDRKTLRVTHPAYLELVDTLHEQLHEVIRDARELLYEAPNRERKKKRAAEDKRQTKKLVASTRQWLSESSAQALEATENQSTLAKKISFIEMIELASRVAAKTLRPGERRQFLASLIREVLEK